MEWVAGRDAAKRWVSIPDALVDGVLEAVDRPRGSFPLDPYRDYQITLQRVPEALGNLRSAADARGVHLRAVIQARLHLKQWPAWADAVLQDAQQHDALLTTLRELGELCAWACSVGTDVQILGE